MQHPERRLRSDLCRPFSNPLSSPANLHRDVLEQRLIPPPLLKPPHQICKRQKVTDDRNVPYDIADIFPILEIFLFEHLDSWTWTKPSGTKTESRQSGVVVGNKKRLKLNKDKEKRDEQWKVGVGSAQDRLDE